MKKFFLPFLFLAVMVGVKAQSFEAATYNLRFDNPRDTLDLWKNRYPVIGDLVRFYNIDIFGTQEGLHHQLTDLTSILPKYDFIGVGRDDGKEGGEYAAIFYKKTKFKILDQGTFWLSQETDHPNKGWDAALPRICTWGKFRETDTGFTFFMFNVHFDHIGVQARMESAKLILSKIAQMVGKTPVILTGDFNVDETNESYAFLKNSGVLQDSYDLAETRFAPNGTFNGFEVGGKPVGRIDHIFLSKGFEVSRYGILTNTYNGRYPSDHFPVVIKLQYKKK